MENNYMIAYKTEWNKLKKLSPEDISKRLKVDYLKDKEEYIVHFLGENHVLDIENERIYTIEHIQNLIITDSIIILNYLTYSSEYIINTNKWVTLKELPNGGALFYPSFHSMAIKKIINKFGNDLEGFEDVCKRLGGVKNTYGDKSFVFNVLPKIDICIAIWEGDDEIDSNATILFDNSIKDLMHIEAIIGLGICIAEKLIN